MRVPERWGRGGVYRCAAHTYYPVKRSAGQVLVQFENPPRTEAILPPTKRGHQASFHCRSHAQRLMNAAETVVRTEQRGFYILCLSADRGPNSIGLQVPYTDTSDIAHETVVL